jgi:membrane protein insertase Oxa1/YidC/SpoIIIJ
MKNDWACLVSFFFLFFRLDAHLISHRGHPNQPLLNPSWADLDSPSPRGIHPPLILFVLFLSDSRLPMRLSVPTTRSRQMNRSKFWMPVLINW